MSDNGGLLRPLDLIASGATLVGDSVQAAAALGRARLVRPLRPDRPPRALAAVSRWGFTPAGGYMAGAALYPDAEAIVDERGALTFTEVDKRSYNLYGSTEVAWVAIAGPKDLREAPGTAGRPPRGTELKILGDDDRPLPPCETGRIFVRNSMLFEGYTGGGSKDVVDGMMATGDVGYLDEEGRLFVEGRDDDMIVSGGENVFPQEVEETLAEHSDVAEAAVVGIEHEKWGQALKAYVVKKGSVDEKALKKHVKDNLAGYKVPQEIDFVDELPRNAAGKVLKRELEEQDAG